MNGHRILMGVNGPSHCSVCGGSVGFDLPTCCPHRTMLAVEMVNIADGKLNCVRVDIDRNAFIWAPNVVEVAGNPDDVEISQVVLH